MTCLWKIIKRGIGTGNQQPCFKCPLCLNRASVLYKTTDFITNIRIRCRSSIVCAHQISIKAENFENCKNQNTSCASQQDFWQKAGYTSNSKHSQYYSLYKQQSCYQYQQYLMADNITINYRLRILNTIPMHLKIN